MISTSTSTQDSSNFVCSHSQNRCHFNNFYKKNFFSKTQDNRLVVIVAKNLKKLHGPFFMDGVKLPPRLQALQGGSLLFTIQFPEIPGIYSFYQPQKDERLSQPWSHPVVLNTRPLDWESSTLIALNKCIK